MTEYLPDAAWRQQPALMRLVQCLSTDGGAVRLVGGAVRDGLLGLAVSDVDLATPLLPEAVIVRLEGAGIKAVPTGVSHGTVTAVVDGQPFEVTTLRRDVATDGRRATIAYSNDWQEDAARRDFTINAIYADPFTGVLFDWFGGIADLRAGRVCFIGQAAQRIAEDHLRILRFYRFAARFGHGALDDASHRAVIAARHSLRTLSRERVADELFKLLALPNPTAMVAQMAADGVLAEVLPEADGDAIERLRRLARSEEMAGTGPDAGRRLAALLPSRAAALAAGARLRLSNRMRERLATLAEHRDTDCAVPIRHVAYRIGTEAARDCCLLRGGGDQIRESMNQLENWSPPRFPVRGGQLIARGIVAGPAVARLLQDIEARWIADGFPEGEALEALIVQALATEPRQ